MSSKSRLFVDTERGVDWNTAQAEHYAKQEGFDLFQCRVGHILSQDGSGCPAVIMEWGTGRPWRNCWSVQTPWRAVR